MTTGPDAIHELIEESGWSYPVRVRKLEREHAFANVPVDAKGNSVMVAELLADVDAREIESRDELERLFGPVFEREAESRRVGLFGKVKRAFYGR
ncbi:MULTISPECIES: hypothetical protein [Halorussus]|uniref:hypothetical protein n=1 Tax=Halorussus TaxID=1070314 RepID=UPI00209DC4EB|nr:hypothetical protein [Halorussus vallis]USZ74574.1 hypothetical protein NGM07_14125 [Halorussus vallis]